MKLKASEESELFVDTRWGGAHGIGRYSTEVLCRLDSSWTSLRFRGSPSNPIDPFIGFTHSVGKTIYSPGFNPHLGSKRNLLTIHDLIHLDQSSKNFRSNLLYYELLVKPAVKKCGAVITVSDTSVRSIKNWLRDENVEVINAGAACADVFISTPQLFQVVNGHVLILGSLKNHKNLIPPIHSLTSCQDVTASVVVPQKDFREVVELVKEHNLHFRVTVKHSLSDQELVDEYDKAEVTIFPSLKEGFGLPALESIARNTPVLYSQGCESVSEIVGMNGLEVPLPSLSSSWAEAINFSMHRKILANTAATRKYSWHNTSRIVSGAISRFLR